MEIGKRIQVRRKKMGLTTEALAKMVGCTASRIQQFEANIIPANTNRGAIAKVKRILKVRNRGGVARPRPTKIRTLKPGRQNADSALFQAVKALHLEVERLSRAVSTLAAKSSIPSNRIRDAAVVKPNPEATAETAPTAAPESLAA